MKIRKIVRKLSITIIAIIALTNNSDVFAFEMSNLEKDFGEIAKLDVISDSDFEILSEKNDNKNFIKNFKTEYISDEFKVNTTTLTIKSQPSFSKDYLLKGNEHLTYIQHQKVEVISTSEDNSLTARMYFTIIFDKWTVDSIVYARVDQYKFKIDVLDGRFRAKALVGKVGQTGATGLDSKGNRKIGRSFSKDISINYPSPGVYYSYSTGFNEYIGKNMTNFIGGWIELQLDRPSSPTAPILKIKDSIYY